MKTLKFILIFIFVLLLNSIVFSQTVTFCIKGEVLEVDDRNNLLNSGIAANDILAGTITYDLSVSEDDTHGNTVPQVGDYYNYNSPTA
jgi:hypothetical protein